MSLVNCIDRSSRGRDVIFNTHSENEKVRSNEKIRIFIICFCSLCSLNEYRYTGLDLNLKRRSRTLSIEE